MRVRGRRPVPPIVQDVLGTAGEPLDVELRATMGARFGHDFSRVRVHADSRAAESARAVAARAYAVGDNIVFGSGEYKPQAAAGRRLVAHELTHVIQQGHSAEPTRPLVGPAAPAVEAQAEGVAATVSAGHPAPSLTRVLDPAVLACSELSDRLTRLRDQAKGAVFDELRRSGPAPGDMAAHSVLEGRFAADTDDRWLAETLLRHGAEPLWPAELIEQRAARARDHGWGRRTGETPELGDIAAILPVPPGADTTAVPPITAFFFPGRTGERALIIGGVHGREPQGARVVEQLRAELGRICAAGHPPYYSTILVPVLNRRTHDVGQPAQGARYLPRNPTDTQAQAERTGIEPNRTFPMPGEDLADVTTRHRAGGSELLYRPRRGPDRPPQGEHATAVMPPETRALITLIEQFRPSRIVSVHAHSIGSTRAGRLGNDPGVFVDPVVANPNRPAGQNLAFDPAGETLGRRMLAEGRRRLPDLPEQVRSGRFNPFLGNVGGAVQYDPDAPHAQGYSLGNWAPVPTVSRAGITTLTVEIPQYRGRVPAAAAQAVEDLHRDLLRDIFLGPP